MFIIQFHIRPPFVVAKKNELWWSDFDKFQLKQFKPTVRDTSLCDAIIILVRLHEGWESVIPQSYHANINAHELKISDLFSLFPKNL